MMEDGNHSPETQPWAGEEVQFFTRDERVFCLHAASIWAETETEGEQRAAMFESEHEF